MKIFRNIFTAIIVGILGGFLFTTVSYYNHHKDGGIFQTLMAVLNSYDTVARAYAGEDNPVSNLADYDIEKEVLAAFDEVDGTDASLYGELLSSLLDNAEDGSEGDV